ncbi:restriction endonuclease subunit S [Methanomicrobiaceae archaeon CYW5]|nr:restriction endonuclease subunit S [Methanovulcanius yangii]
MNETLEAIAQAIFTSWFVDFDPVRAKAEGRQPEGMDEETAALFPDGFEVVDGREVPKGWTVESLDCNIEFMNGLACQKYPPIDELDSLPVIKIRELNNGITSNTDKASKSVPLKYLIKNGDILFSWSGSLQICIWSYGEGILNQHLFKVSSELYPKWFCYLWTHHFLEDFRSIAADKATTMGHIKRHNLRDAKIIVPPMELFSEIDQILSPLIEMQINNAIHSRTLAEIRDQILPKLISGEIRVKVA